MRKMRSNKMLVLPNVTIEPSNVRKKIKEPPNMTKTQSHVILVLHNLRMILSNVRKNMSTTKCGKSTIKCDVSIAQCDNGTIKCEKKIRKP